MIGKAITMNELMKKENNEAVNDVNGNFFKKLFKTADGRCSTAHPYWGTVLKSVYRMDEHFDWLVPNFSRRTIDFKTGKNMNWDMNVIKNKLSTYSSYANYYFNTKRKEKINFESGTYDIILAYSNQQFNENVSLTIDGDVRENINIVPQSKVTWNAKRKRGYSKVYYIILNNVDINSEIEIETDSFHLKSMYIMFAKRSDEVMDAIDFPTLEMPVSVKYSTYGVEYEKQMELIENVKHNSKYEEEVNSYEDLDDDDSDYEEDSYWGNKFKDCKNYYHNFYPGNFSKFLKEIQLLTGNDLDDKIMDFLEDCIYMENESFSSKKQKELFKKFKIDNNIQ